MLGLRRETNPAWARAAAAEPLRILVDHAHCEKKAAASALSLITKYPTRREMVDRLAELAREELDHFVRVVAELRKRGADLGADRPDLYVNRLRDLVRGREPEHFLDRLLVSALIEARSCERFQILAREAPDAELRALYGDLLASEAGHYALFTDLARLYFGKPVVEARLAELESAEAEIVASLDNDATMHG
jgi:tRNA-(ms[2]io[6]A)-hydroxylase